MTCLRKWRSAEDGGSDVGCSRFCELGSNRGSSVWMDGGCINEDLVSDGAAVENLIYNGGKNLVVTDLLLVSNGCSWSFLRRNAYGYENHA
jgi:hypothetical protein